MTYLFIFVLLTLFLSGCSMMPNDEEIINGSILEKEILNDEELVMDNEEGEEKNQIEDDEFLGIDVVDENDEENEKIDSEIQFEILD